LYLNTPRWIVTNLINRKVLGTVCLVIATFLNPFGFDILVYKLTLLTKDYWYTMYVLYAFALLSFGLSFLSFKLSKKGLGNLFLSIAMFLNPLGYDLIVYWINTAVANYWMTMSIMYMLSGLFFGCFIYLYDINPLVYFKTHAKETHKKIKTKIKKNGQVI